MMEIVKLPHFEEYTLVVGLFTNVANALFLRRQLLEGNTDFEYAFMDGGMVPPAPSSLVNVISIS